MGKRPHAGGWDRRYGGARYSDRKRSKVEFASVEPWMRAYHKARRPRKKSAPLRLSVTAFPKTAVVKHKYCCRGTLSCTPAGATQVKVIRANSLFDPEYSAGATQHQPLLFDQMAALYDHYTVTSASITCKVYSDAEHQVEAYGIDPLAIALQLKDVATAPISAFTIREQPNTSYTTLIAPQRMYKLKKSYNAKSFHGKKVVVGEPELSGSIAANPTEGAYFILSVTDLGVAHDGETDSTYPLHYEMDIIQTATWTERKAITAS